MSVLTNAVVYVAGYDLSGDFNSVALASGAAEVNDTMFGDTTESAAGGLKTATMEVRGAWNGGADNDKVLFDRIGLANVPVMSAAAGGDAGEAAYFMQALAANFQTFGAVGELMPMSLSARASGGTPLVRGTVLYNDTITATANGTAYQVGAASASQKLYAALFILDDPAGTDPTLDVVIQSDDNSGMSSATNRITFAQQTARGAVWATPVSGAITDDYWRASITVGGTGSPSFRVAVVLGIL